MAKLEANARISQVGGNWFHFISLSGEPGRLWVESFMDPKYQEPRGEMIRALKILRQREIGRGLELLENIESCLHEMKDVPGSIFLVMERQFYPIKAFYHYLIEDYEGARRLLDRAQDSMAQAIGKRRFLIPMADCALDFGLQRIRIARNLRAWKEMKQLAQAVRDMIAGQRPFLILDDGTSIDYDAMIAFYASLPLSAEDRASIAQYDGNENRQRYFSSMIDSIFVLPGFVIPYP